MIEADGELSPFTGDAVVVYITATGAIVVPRLGPAHMIPVEVLDGMSVSLVPAMSVSVEDGIIDPDGPIVQLQPSRIDKYKHERITAQGHTFARPASWSLGRDHNKLWDEAEIVLLDADAPSALVRHPDPEFGTGGKWLLPTAWAAEVHEKQAAAQVTKQARDQLAGEFVNPYNFVSIPAGEIDRRRARGHHTLNPQGAESGLMGKITVRWTARTSIMAPSPAQGGAGAGADGHRQFVRLGQTPIIPGVSLKGLVRSTHEALCAGCMRVLDTDYAPVHREQVGSGRRQWPMVRVREVSSAGLPVAVDLAADVVWVDSALLNPGDRRCPATGDRFTLDTSSEDSRTGRKLLRRPLDKDGNIRPNTPDGDDLQEYQTIARPDPQGDWYLMVSDTGPRQPKNNTYFALGRFNGVGAGVTVAETAARSLLRRAAGTNDVREEFGNHAQNATIKDKHERKFKRQRVRTQAHVGDLFWGQLSDTGQGVVELSVSQVWRKHGLYQVSERVGDVGPCTSVDNLCVTCRLFGATDDQSENRHEQNGYRSHLRFGAAHVVEGTVQRPAEGAPRLAPTGRPRPSAGQNYLSPPAGGRTNATHHKGETADEPPLSNWGSEADSTSAGIRRIRGRKHYWHGSSDAQQQYWSTRGQPLRRRDQAGPYHKTNVTQPAPETLPAGAVFEGTIWFENLSVSELGQVLAALDPNLVRDHLVANSALNPPEHQSGLRGNDELLVHLGGGKPLGFGSVRPSIESVDIHDAASRYMGATSPPVDVETAVAAFVEGVSDVQRQGWPELYALHHASWADPASIWYPPAQRWDSIAVGGRAHEEFDRSFEFFSRSGGKAFDNPSDAAQAPFTPLPLATDNPTQSIDPAVK